jgi:WD40 repeat protein
VLDLVTGTETAVLRGHAGPVAAVVWSPDGRRLATAGGDGVRLWDARSGQEVLALPAPLHPDSPVTFSPDGRRLAAVGGDGRVLLWDAPPAREPFTFRGHAGSDDGRVARVAFTPDASRVVSLDDGWTLRLWGTATGQELLASRRHRGNGDEPRRAMLSPDGKLLAVSVYREAGEVKVWESATGREVATLAAGGDWSSQPTFAWDGAGRRLAYVAKVDLGTGEKHDLIRVWDAAAGKDLVTLAGRGPVERGRAAEKFSPLLLSPDGKRAAAGVGYTSPEDVRLWDVDTGKEVMTLTGAAGFAFSPDGRWLAAGRLAGTAKDRQRPGQVVLVDAETGKEVHAMAGLHPGAVTAVAFSADGQRLASAAKDPSAFNKPGEIKVWDVERREEVRTLPGQGFPAAGAVFSPDGRFLVSADANGGPKVWDLETGKEFTPEGDGASAPGKLLKWLDKVAGTALAPPEVGGGPVVAVAFSADGRLLAEARGGPERAGVVRVYDTRTRKEVRTLLGHTDRVRSLAFSPDGAWLATGSDDRTVKLWPLRAAAP